MSEDLYNEIEAINSIYGDETLVATNEEDIYVLRLPQQDATLRLHFPLEYPATPPSVLGVQSSGEHTRKGEAAYLVDVFRDVLSRAYQPGQVCLFDVIEDINQSMPNTLALSYENETVSSSLESANSPHIETKPKDELQVGELPPWCLSDVVVESKSVFVARCAPVSSPAQAKFYLQHLLDSDKKVRSATHNITAWRIKGDFGITYQDCDDDGETAAGGRVLHLMQLMDIWNAMVVVTRWYGGHQLGPKRFSIINSVARDAFVKGEFFKEDSASKKKNKH